mgnify:CR=1 FL=1
MDYFSPIMVHPPLFWTGLFLKGGGWSSSICTDYNDIFDEIQVHSIPVKYIDRLKVILKDGTEIDTADPEHQKRVISAVDVADIKDLQISLDYDAIKKDVTNENWKCKFVFYCFAEYFVFMFWMVVSLIISSFPDSLQKLRC